MGNLASPGPLGGAHYPCGHRAIAFPYSVGEPDSRSFTAKSTSRGNPSPGRKYWQGVGELSPYFQIKYLSLRLRTSPVPRCILNSRDTWKGESPLSWTDCHHPVGPKFCVAPLVSYSFPPSPAAPPAEFSATCKACFKMLTYSRDAPAGTHLPKAQVGISAAHLVE